MHSSLLHRTARAAIWFCTMREPITALTLTTVLCTTLLPLAKPIQRAICFLILIQAPSTRLHRPAWDSPVWNAGGILLIWTALATSAITAASMFTTKDWRITLFIDAQAGDRLWTRFIKSRART